MASKRVHPNAHTSAPRSYGLPLASSGLMYSGVPTCASATSSVFESTLDSPKSPSRTSPSAERKTLLGFTSRCSSLMSLCRYSSALPSCIAYRLMSVSVNRAFSLMRFLMSRPRSPPAAYSMTMHTLPSFSKVPMYPMMLG